MGTRQEGLPGEGPGGGPGGGGRRPPGVVVEWVPQETAPTWADLSAGGEWPDKPSPPAWIRGQHGSGRRRVRRLIRFAAMTLAVLVAIPVAIGLFLEFRITHSAALAGDTGPSAASDGVNWLIVGSDSRQGLTRQDEDQLVTGHDVSGMRSDTMMLLHVPSSGGPATLISLPRDSYVPIPGHGRNKLNTAFSIGGPSLLAETVQNATGLPITHFADIGFGGLVSVVNSVGGVRICVSQNLDDRSSGTHLSAGCQAINGEQALSFVRDRHSFQNGDLEREQNQRTFLEALLRKATSPAVYLNPVAAVKTTLDASGSLSVDKGTHLWDLARLARPIPSAKTLNVPIAGSGTVPDLGDVLYWNQPKAHALFAALANGQQAPGS